MTEDRLMQTETHGRYIIYDNKITLREETSALQKSATLKINEQVRQSRERGENVLHMGFGESPFPVHTLLQQALVENAGKNMYLPAAGLAELRDMAAAYFGKVFNLETKNYKCIIGPGSKALIFSILMAIEGDLLLPVPSWVSYAPQARLLGDRVINIKTTIDNRYHPTVESLEESIRRARRQGLNPTKLIINYPNNPTGLSMDSHRLSEIADVCRKFGILVISDEIYGLVRHHGKHVSIGSIYPEGTIITCGLSKHLSLGGYRLGTVLFPQSLEFIKEAVVNIASEIWSTVSAPIQFAALRAFEGLAEIEEYIDACRRIHAMIAGYVHKSLGEIGIHYPPLDGGFYLYPDFAPHRDLLIRKEIVTSEGLAQRLFEETRIATLPGTAFGDGSENLRLRLATCDFDGEAALTYLEENPDCSAEELVSTCARNINVACQRLEDFFTGE